MKKIINILCSISLICALTACSTKEQAFSKSAFFFDTHVSITIYDENDLLLEKCMLICEKMENIFSKTKTTSELYKINHRSSNTVVISDEMKTVLEKGLEAYQISAHRFDMSVAPFMDLYDFTGKQMIPTEQELAQASINVGSHLFTLKENTLTFANDQIQLDTGALAKGYIADVLKTFLIENGISSALINLGGNVLCIGSKPNEKSWNVGIQKPFDQKGEAIYTIKATDVSVVSSGVYERCFEKGGVLYHHLIDATTGKVTHNGLWQVSIITPSSLNADMLSSTIFLMGLEEGMKYIESLEDCEAIFVDEKGEIHLSSGLK